MKTAWLTTAALVTGVGLGLVGCGEAGGPEAPEARQAPQADAAQVQDKAQKKAPEKASALETTLQQRLFALDYFATKMWPADQPDAALVWLRSSAAAHGLTLTREIPEPVAVASSVAARRIGVRAQGDWADLLQWLTAIEASPQRIVARDIALHRLREHDVADLALTALMDRPAGLTALGKTDLAELDQAGMTQLIAEIDADLAEKGQTLNRLGAEVSWSRPIEEITAALPEGATPVRLELSRGDTGERAQRFTGSFTAQLPDAAAVEPMLDQLAQAKGFAQVREDTVTGVGASFVRVVADFTWGAAQLDEDQGPTAGQAAEPRPLKNPF